MSRIERQALVEMFDNIQSGTPWDLSGDMLWGYFFTDPDPEKLARAGDLLVERGYHLVHVRPPDEEDDEALHWLHVERIETHSVDSLHARNGDLYGFAEKLGLHSYDGMDVGPAPGPQ